MISERRNGEGEEGGRRLASRVTSPRMGHRIWHLRERQMGFLASGVPVVKQRNENRSNRVGGRSREGRPLRPAETWTELTNSSQ